MTHSNDDTPRRPCHPGLSLFIFVVLFLRSFGCGRLEIESDAGDDGNLGMHRQLAGLNVAVGVEATVVSIARAIGANKWSVSPPPACDFFVMRVDERVVKRLRIANRCLLLYVDHRRDGVE